MRLVRTFLLAAMGFLAACGSHRIPGTEIADNSDTRAIVGLIEQYRVLSERRDAKGVLALVSERYFDDAGTPDPGDDIDYGQLRQRLTADFAKVSALRLDIALKGIDVKDDQASAYVFYDEHYRIATRSGEVARQASDAHRMRFVREAGTWKFVSGL